MPDLTRQYASARDVFTATLDREPTDPAAAFLAGCTHLIEQLHHDGLLRDSAPVAVPFTDADGAAAWIVETAGNDLVTDRGVEPLLEGHYEYAVARLRERGARLPDGWVTTLREALRLIDAHVAAVSA